MSGCLAIVELEYPAESLTADALAFDLAGIIGGIDEFDIEPLVIASGVTPAPSAFPIRNPVPEASRSAKRRRTRPAPSLHRIRSPAYGSCVCCSMLVAGHGATGRTLPKRVAHFVLENKKCKFIAIDRSFAAL